MNYAKKKTGDCLREKEKCVIESRNAKIFAYFYQTSSIN